MRVLMTSWAWPSHYLPLVPLAWALRAAGHDVRVASQPRLAPTITASGAVAVPVGPDLDHDEVRRNSMKGMWLPDAPQAPQPGTSMRSWEPGEREKVSRVFGVFTAYAEAMADEVFAYARGWRPDLVIHDPTTYVGPLVAAALGVPAVRHVHGVDVTHQANEVVAELVAPLARRLGVPDVNLLGDLTVDPCPPSMQIPVGVKRRFIRWVPYNGPASIPSWLWEKPERKRLCITWGTSTTRLTGLDTFMPPKVISYLEGCGWEIVVALTGPDASALGKLLPPEVRVVESLPLHLLLPTCDAVIHQGGNGTILTAIHDGVPQLVLPQLPDQTFHADRLAETGAGVVLRPSEVDPERVRAALAQVMQGDECRSAAARLRSEMLAQPTPADIVPELEALAA